MPLSTSAQTLAWGNWEELPNWGIPVGILPLCTCGCGGFIFDVDDGDGDDCDDDDDGEQVSKSWQCIQ